MDIEEDPPSPSTPKVAPWRALLYRLSTLIFGWLIKAAIAIALFFGGLYLFTLSFPPITLSLFFTGRMWCWNKHRKKWRKEPTRATIYKKKAQTETTRNKIQPVSVVLATRLGMMVLCWLILNLSVPHLGRVRFLGSPLWKWSLLLTVIFILNPALLLGSCMLEYLLWIWRSSEDANFRFFIDFIEIQLFLEYLVGDDYEDDVSVSVEYWTRGVEHSARWVIYHALILLVWIIYFFANQGEIEQMHQAHLSKRVEIKQNLFPRIHKYIILTLVSLLVGAIMGLVRDLARLWWKSKYIYTTPNKVQILVAAFRLYLLFYIINDNTLDPISSQILIPYDLHKKRLDDALNSLEAEPQEQLPSLRRKDTRPIDRFMRKMSEVVGLSEIDKAAKWLTQTFQEIPDDIGSAFVKGVLDEYYGTSADDSSDQPQSYLPDDEQELFRRRKGIRMAKLVLKLVRVDLGKSPTDAINRKDYEEWMIFAHRSCFVDINKLHGSLELADILSKVLAAFQIFATFITWLFITGLATTKLMLTLGSLFVGLVFIFGDTCKEAFRGFIFSFITHPFGVGDQVEINGIKLEVERINIMTTVFKIKDGEALRTVIYPNSNLAGINITKLKIEGEGKAAYKHNQIKMEREGEAAGKCN